jgi:hypothetical protein
MVIGPRLVPWILRQVAPTSWPPSPDPPSGPVRAVSQARDCPARLDEWRRRSEAKEQERSLPSSTWSSASRSSRTWTSRREELLLPFRPRTAQRTEMNHHAGGGTIVGSAADSSSRPRPGLLTLPHETETRAALMSEAELTILGQLYAQRYLTTWLVAELVLRRDDADEIVGTLRHAVDALRSEPNATPLDDRQYDFMRRIMLADLGDYLDHMRTHRAMKA